MKSKEIIFIFFNCFSEKKVISMISFLIVEKCCVHIIYFVFFFVDIKNNKVYNIKKE